MGDVLRQGEDQSRGTFMFLETFNSSSSLRRRREGGRGEEGGKVGEREGEREGRRDGRRGREIDEGEAVINERKKELI